MSNQCIGVRHGRVSTRESKPTEEEEEDEEKNTKLETENRTHNNNKKIRYVLLFEMCNYIRINTKSGVITMSFQMK